MSTALKIAARVIARRVTGGESIDDALQSYPKMNDDEKEQIKAYVSKN